MIKQAFRLFPVFFLAAWSPSLRAEFQALDNFQAADGPLSEREGWVADDGFQLVTQALWLPGGNHLEIGS